MEKINFLCLLFLFLVLSVSAQNIKIIKIKEYDNDELLNKEYKEKIANKERMDKIYSFKPRINNGKTHVDSILSSFNVKKGSPLGDYFVAYFEGEVQSRYIGFFDRDENLINYHEIEIEPSVNFSSNGDFVAVFSLSQNNFFVFNKKGQLIYQSSYREISDNILYNIFIDDKGENILINTSYEITLYSIKKQEVIWKNKIEFRRIGDCVFNLKLDLLYAKSLFDKKDWVGDDKYSIEILSKINGTVKGQILKVALMLIEKDRILVKTGNKWGEYEIK